MRRVTDKEYDIAKEQTKSLFNLMVSYHLQGPEPTEDENGLPLLSGGFDRVSPLKQTKED